MEWWEYVLFGVIVVASMIGGVWSFKKRKTGTITIRNSGRIGSSGKSTRGN